MLRLRVVMPVLAAMLIVVGCANQRPRDRLSFEASAADRCAPMPFGSSSFGPWDVGTWPGVAGRSSAVGVALPRTSLSDLPWWAAMSFGGVSLSVDEEAAKRLESERVQSDSVLGREAALRWLQDACDRHGLKLSVGAEFVSIGLNEAENSISADPTYGGRFRASFADCDPVEAIIAVAKAASVQVFVPAQPKPGINGPVKKWPRVSLYMRSATPDQILRRLAQLADLGVRVNDDADGPSYFFEWPK